MNSGWSSIQTCSLWLWLYLQPHSCSAFCWRWDVSLRWNASENISSEIPTGEKGGRRGVLLPGQERRGARAVSPADDGSLWVSKLMSQCFQRPCLWPHVEAESWVFYPNSRVCMKMSGLSVWQKIQNQSSGLQTLRLVNFTELSIDFSFVYKRKASLIPENRHVDLRRTPLKSILPSVSDDVDILGIFLKTFGVVLFFFCLAACICHSLKRGCFHNKSHSENKWVKGRRTWNLWRNVFLFTDLLLVFLATTGQGPIMGLSMATQMR